MSLGIPVRSVVTRSAGTFGGLAGLTAAFTLLFLAMRRVGGSCASGGPYAVTNRCPDGLDAAVLLAIFGGLTAFAAYGLTRFAAGPRLSLLAGPVLLLVLAWTFVADYYGPGGAGSTLVVGVVFAAVGVALLSPLIRPRNLRLIFWNDGRVPKRRFQDWSKSAAKAPGADATAIDTVATNLLTQTEIRRTQTWSGALHVAALVAGVWVGIQLTRWLLG